jgi:Ca-activated chloride channel family protein
MNPNTPRNANPSHVFSGLDVARRLPWIDAYGATSLYDAIAGTSREMAGRRRPRQAVVAVTDGVDTSSVLDAVAVSRLASTIDVPVYVLAVAPLQAPSHVGADAATVKDPAASLKDLARWTGGRLYLVAGPAGASLAARNIVTELRHQYLIGFEPSAQAGWHPLSIRTRQKDLVVRARSGYVSGTPVG